MEFPSFRVWCDGVAPNLVFFWSKNKFISTDACHCCWLYILAFFWGCEILLGKIQIEEVWLIEEISLSFQKLTTGIVIDLGKIKVTYSFISWVFARIVIYQAFYLFTINFQFSQLLMNILKRLFFYIFKLFFSFANLKYSLFAVFNQFIEINIVHISQLF